MKSNNSSAPHLPQRQSASTGCVKSEIVPTISFWYIVTRFFVVYGFGKIGVMYSGFSGFAVGRSIDYVTSYFCFFP